MCIVRGQLCSVDLALGAALRPAEGVLLPLGSALVAAARPIVPAQLALEPPLHAVLEQDAVLAAESRGLGVLRLLRPQARAGPADAVRSGVSHACCELDDADDDHGTLPLTWLYNSIL